MEVGIIGLKPRQAAQLEALNFNAQIALYPHETYDQVRVSAFCRQHENIILLAGHVPRRLMTDTPSARTKVIPGNVGISSVIAHLESTYGYQEKKAEQTEVETVTESAPAAAPVKKVGGLNGWKYSLVTGHAVRYDPGNTEHASLERPGPSGRFTYGHLAALRPGDLLRYPRNPGETDGAAYQRFQYLRKTQLADLVIDVEIHVFEDYVDLYAAPAKCTMKQAESWKRISKQRVLIDMMHIGHRLNVRERENEEIADTVLASLGLGQSTAVLDVEQTVLPAGESLATVEMASEQSVVAVPAVWQAGLAKVNTPSNHPENATVTTVEADLSTEERAFWERVYVAAVTAGADPERAQRYAVQALAHRKAL